MPNFLEICKRVRQEVGYSGTGPDTVVGNSGVYKKVVDWVSRAYLDIQKENARWAFLWEEVEFSTVIGQKVYTPTEIGIEDLKMFDTDSFYVQRSSINNKFPLSFLSFEEFRDFSAIETTSNPNFFTILPNRSLKFESYPIAPEVITFEYWKQPIPFVADTDFPLFDAEHHDIILYKAMMYYGADEEAVNIYSDAKANYQSYLNALSFTELSNKLVRTSPLA